MKLMVVVGGQFGSEAKGAVAGHLLKREVETFRKHGWSDPIYNIRVAGPNAGHTIVDDNGVRHALRSIPVGAVFPAVQLHIAAGSEVDLDVLELEVSELAAHGINVAGRLTIHPQATVLGPEYIAMESVGGITERIGSTSKGIGQARAARAMRDARIVGNDPKAQERIERLGLKVAGLPVSASGRLNFREGSVLIEGTQGYGLGLHAGYYPYCTSSDCRAIDFMAMAGINPWSLPRHQTQIWIAARPYPIRVAGNSGPLLNETTWEQLGLAQEQTTVTKKVRRVGHWDPALVRDAVVANGGGRMAMVHNESVQFRLALTMLDQVDPNVAGAVDIESLIKSELVWNHINRAVRDADCEIGIGTTSDRTAVWFDEC